MEGERDWLTVGEVARLKGVSEQAVRAAIRDGRLAADRANGAFLVRRRDADAWTPRRKEGA